MLKKIMNTRHPSLPCPKMMPVWLNLFATTIPFNTTIPYNTTILLYIISCKYLLYHIFYLYHPMIALVKVKKTIFWYFCLMEQNWKYHISMPWGMEIAHPTTPPVVLRAHVFGSFRFVCNPRNDFSKFVRHVFPMLSQ